MNVAADLTLCQGHQMCQFEAPEVFGFETPFVGGGSGVPPARAPQPFLLVEIEDQPHRMTH